MLNMEAVGRTFRQLWRSTNGFKTWKLKGHVVLFVFSNSNDVSRIIQSEPRCFDKHGDYTTRTAYKLLALSKMNKKPTRSTNRRNNQLWKGIWSLQVPYKVKHLIWRAANEALPTLYNLLCRKVVQTVYCPNCKVV